MYLTPSCYKFINQIEETADENDVYSHKTFLKTLQTFNLLS